MTEFFMSAMIEGRVTLFHPEAQNTMLRRLSADFERRGIQRRIEYVKEWIFVRR